MFWKTTERRCEVSVAHVTRRILSASAFFAATCFLAGCGSGGGGGGGGDGSTPRMGTTAASAHRDAFQQPFASTSIWNMPIGRNAAYVPANLPAIPYSPDQWAPMPHIDRDIVVLTPGAPLTNVNFSSAAWTGADRCGATGGVFFQVPIPTDYVVPNNNGNASTVFLQSDGRTLIHTQPFTRCTAGAAGTTLTPASDFPPVDLYGDGIRGSHGGSGLSAI